MMKPSRRLFAAALLSLCSTGGWCQGYPSKPIRFVVPFSAGSGTDTLGRIAAAGLTQTLGQQVVVENRGGAAGNIGADIAAKAPPDGYTLCLINLGHAANVTLYPNLPYSLTRDFAPVTQLAFIPSMVAVHPSLPAKSLGDLVRLAKSRPGSINYGSGGMGSPSFVTGELFKREAGVDLTHVPYKSGAEALTAVMTGEVPIFFAPLATTVPLIRQGRLRGLAVTSAARVAQFPEFPTVAESGYPRYKAGNWYGLVVHSKVPKDIVATLHKAAAAALNDTAISRRMTELGFVIVGDNPDEFSAHIQAEIASLAKVLKGLRPSE